MKKLLFFIATCTMLASCTDNPNYYNKSSDSTVNVVVEEKPAGLDLQALGEIAKTAKSAQDLEEKLNQSGGINDVDLDGDGNVDYLNVVEFGSNNDVGFSITDYTKNSAGGIDTNEVANIVFSKNTVSNQVTTNINGNSSIYGSSNNSYSSTNLLTDLILFNYLFAPHSYYYSPYRYGYYPNYYRSYRYVPASTYNRTVTTRYKTTNYKPTTSVSTVSRVKSPYSNKTSPSVTKEYSAPKTSVKSFSVRTKTEPVKNNAFRNTSTSGSSYKSSSYSPYKSSSSYSPFKSSGSSYKSSGSSYRSSSSGFKSSSSRRR
jgi:hypothetical protein